METKYLLDTNICVYIRQQKPVELLRRFQKLRAGEAAVSIITYGELMCEAEKSLHSAAALERLRELALLISPLPLPETAGPIYGKIRAELETRGEMIGNNDLWIASHAVAAQLILVTNNEKEFRRVSGLKVQNWVRT